MAKYITAILGGIFMFLAVSLLVGMLLGVVLPRSWWTTVLQLGIINGNVPSFIAVTVGGLAARHSFLASLRGKSKKTQPSHKHEARAETEEGHRSFSVEEE